MPDISHISLTGRPLIISDVDDVVLEFVEPLGRFLFSEGLRFVPKSFHLSGNIVHIDDAAPIADSEIKSLLDRFFDQQHRWQTPFEHALSSLEDLSREADIVFLTAMPPQFADRRRDHLAKLGLPFPLIATESPKGPVAARMGMMSNAPVVFVDDMAHNLVSVAEHLPACLLLSLVPPSDVHKMAPKPPEAAKTATNWREASILIRDHFSINAIAQSSP
jgi:hypothetical protein